jgi:hypothetical protein
MSNELAAREIRIVKATIHGVMKGAVNLLPMIAVHNSSYCDRWTIFEPSDQSMDIFKNF